MSPMPLRSIHLPRTNLTWSGIVATSFVIDPTVLCLPKPKSLPTLRFRLGRRSRGNGDGRLLQADEGCHQGRGDHDPPAELLARSRAGEERAKGPPHLHAV